MICNDKHIAPVTGKYLLRFSIVLLLLFGIYSADAQIVNAQSSASKEYRIKAVFLFNFTQFVEWPANAFSGPSAPFVIGILGDDPFGAYLDEAVANEKVNGHPLVVQRFRDIKDAKNCQILFLNSPDPEKLKENLSVVNAHVLTVSDADNFARMGGMIRFVKESNRIRLQINPEAARSSELLISSKLLRVSDIYDPKNPPR